MTDLDALLHTARRAADAAADVHRRHYGNSHGDTTTAKGRSDFVSAVDLEAQERIVEIIEAAHPAHEILGEEDGLGHGADRHAGALWIVDPLDGTTNFLHGHPYFASSVAVAVDGVLRAGAVTATATGERWWAARGQGAWHEGPDARPARCHVSAETQLANALVGTGFPFKAIDALPDYLQQFDRVLRASAGIRRAGAAALDLCFMASGRLDAFWEHHLAPWDIAAGWLILEEAGGVCSRPDGCALDLAPGAVVAANGPAFLERLQGLINIAGRPCGREK